jgi:hypothetical protein
MKNKRKRKKARTNYVYSSSLSNNGTHEVSFCSDGLYKVKNNSLNIVFCIFKFAFCFVKINN